MASGLASVPQESFGSGMWRIARHLIPNDGAYDLENYLIDDDGNPYWRGGPSYLSTSAFGTGLSPMLWDGQLTPGQRTVIATGTAFGVLNSVEAPLDLGGSPFVVGLTNPTRPVELAARLFFGPKGGSNAGSMYGGSRINHTYSTGTVTVTNGSKTVTGAGTTWAPNLDSGSLFHTAAHPERIYVVESVNTNTSITLTEAWKDATAAGGAYTLESIADVTLTGITTATLLTHGTRWYVVAGNRLWVLSGSVALFSAIGDPQLFNEAGGDYHRLPDGAELLGGHELGESLLLFASTGLHVISGISLDLTDDAGNVQHTRRLANEGLILWAHEGLAPWAGGVIAPCTDSVWLVDGASVPTDLGQSIGPLYRSYVAAGYKTGVAQVFRNHYFLPILNGSNVVQDVLVCRLDRGRGGPRYAGAVTNTSAAWPWTHLAGMGAKVNAFAVRTGSSVRNPKLLGASEAVSSRVLDCTPYFGPDVTNKLEPDGTAISKTLETKDYPTQDGRLKGLVKFLRLRSELKDAASDNPTVAAQWAGQDGTYTALTGSEGEDEFGQTIFSFVVSKQPRFIRFKLTSSSPAARCVVRLLELLIRPSGKRR